MPKKKPSLQLRADQDCRRFVFSQTSGENVEKPQDWCSTVASLGRDRVVFQHFSGLDSNDSCTWRAVGVWLMFPDCSRPVITTTRLSSLSSSPPLQVNGVQPSRRENGLSAKEDAAHFADIIHLSNHGNATNGARDESDTGTASETILTFESQEPFMKKAPSLKTPHVAGMLWVVMMSSHRVSQALRTLLFD